MKIAVLAPSSGSSEGDEPRAVFETPSSGGYLYDAELSRALRESGHEVDELFTDDEDPGGLAARLSAFDAIVEDELGFELYARLNPLLPPAVRRIALVHVPASFLTPSETLAARERDYLETVDGAIFVSEATRTDARHLVGRTLPTVVAGPGREELGSHAADKVDRDFAAPLRFVTIARWLPHKGIRELIAVFEDVANSSAGLGFHLDLVGDRESDSEYGASISAMLTSKALEGRVTSHGRLSRGSIRELFSRAHAYLSPSFYESFGMAAHEALEWGLPVVGWTRGGLRELVRHEQNGLLVEPHDRHGFTSALRRLDENRPLLRALSTCASATRAARPTWRESANRVLSLLETTRTGHGGADVR